MTVPPHTRTAPAVLFDVDGTLVDSNYLHVHAWSRAFTAADLPAEAWRIHRAIGMDGDTLVRTLAPNADDHRRAQVTDLHSRYYRETAAQLRPLPGARELLEAVAKLELQVVLATSASEDDLTTLRNVLDSDRLVSAATSSADVDTAKPEPDIVKVALDRAGVDATRAVFVGDAVWDMVACRRAGVLPIGLLSGGVSQRELENAGAHQVFANTLELCQHLDDTPVAALANSVGAR